jgi:hypothetical protein
MPFFSGGAALRGGNWNNGTNAGAFTLNLNNDPSNSNTNIGFRCSCLRCQTWEKYKCRKSTGKLVGHFSQILRPQGTSILFQGQPLDFNIQWSPKLYQFFIGIIILMLLLKISFYYNSYRKHVCHLNLALLLSFSR